jgi:hypothetical protein
MRVDFILLIRFFNKNLGEKLFQGYRKLECMAPKHTLPFVNIFSNKTLHFLTTMSVYL